MNASGTFVRAPLYDGSEPGFATTAGSLSSGNHNLVTSSISGQSDVTVNTIKFDTANTVNLTLIDGATLTLSNGGLLRAGGGNTTISGGAIITSSGSEYVFRTDSVSDTLTVNSPIVDNSGNALTKSGAGTVVLNGNNTYSGATTVNGGVLAATAAALCRPVPT